MATVVPIIGASSIGQDWLLVLPIKCSCGAHFNLYGQPGAIRKCPECGKPHMLQAMPDKRPNGELAWPLVVGAPTK